VRKEIDMNLELQFEEALKSENPPKSLTELVKRLLKEGVKHEDIDKEVSRFHLFLMSQGRDEDDDIILELGTALDGWCHPDYKL
jgi:hypothetical protein